jgi:hypothetical protein
MSKEFCKAHIHLFPKFYHKIFKGKFIVDHKLYYSYYDLYKHFHCFPVEL